MFIPSIYQLILPTLAFISSQSNAQLFQNTPAQAPGTFDICPRMTVRCVKDGNWPSGIVGDIGKKDFCRAGIRCNQCNIEANTEECNLTFPECEEACDAFAPIPF